MTVKEFLDLLKNSELRTTQLYTLLSHSVVEHIVQQPVDLSLADMFEYSEPESVMIKSNLTKINELIENGAAFFLRHKRQGVEALFQYEGHNRRHVAKINDTRLSSSFV